ncbi:MAG: hypothetical protein R6W87_10220 [Halospina sp.]
MRELSMQEVQEVGGGAYSQLVKYGLASLGGAAADRYINTPVLDTVEYGATQAMKYEAQRHDGPLDRMGHSGAF